MFGFRSFSCDFRRHSCVGYDGSSLRTDRKIFEIELFESSFLGLSKISPSLTPLDSISSTGLYWTWGFLLNVIFYSFMSFINQTIWYSQWAYICRKENIISFLLGVLRGLKGSDRIRLVLLLSPLSSWRCLLTSSLENCSFRFRCSLRFFWSFLGEPDWFLGPGLVLELTELGSLKSFFTIRSLVLSTSVIISVKIEAHWNFNKITC